MRREYPIREHLLCSCLLLNGTRMSTDGTDFHGFLPVLIREIRVNPCPIFKLSGG